MVDNLILSVLSWGTFLYITTYLGVAYYIAPERRCWIFGLYFLLAYLLEVLFLSLMLFAVNKIIGRETSPQDWDYNGLEIAILFLCLYPLSTIVRYIVYDRKHLKKL